MDAYRDPAPGAAPRAARHLLRSAARVLGTVDPSPEVGGLLEGALPLPPGDPRYRDLHPFEPRFSETAGGTLAFSVQVPETGPAGGGGVAAASDEVRHLLGGHLGRRAALWFDRRVDAARSSASGEDTATVLSAYDRDGFREAQTTYRWGPWLSGTLPEPAYRVAEIVLDSLPGAEPAFTTVRAARTSGSQSITFRLLGEVPLAALAPVMDGLGLGAQHQSLTTAVAFALGARYTLPAGSTMLTLRPLGPGLELRLDVDLQAVPDLPPSVAQLLALQLGERPRSLRALEQWVAAFCADGEESPGSLSVLSVTVRPDMPARLAIHVRPHAITDQVGVPG